MSLSLLAIEPRVGSEGNYQSFLQEQGPDINLLALKARGLIREQLFSEDGFMRASSSEGTYGYAFLRDTMWAADDIYQVFPQDSFEWQATKRAVLSFWNWQKDNGLLPHEMRKVDEATLQDPRFQKLMSSGFYTFQTREIFGETVTYAVNGDSIDGTPLALIMTPRFIETEEELFSNIPQFKCALDALKENTYAHDGWYCYKGNEPGLMSQGWMDSEQGSVLGEDGKVVPYWIANVEVQAFAWCALKTWQGILGQMDDATLESFGMDRGYVIDLGTRADVLKQRFNDPQTGFKMQDNDGTYFAHALVVDTSDGVTVIKKDKKIGINPGFALWAAYEGETIFQEESDVREVAKRLTTQENTFGMQSGLFSKEGGIATFASNSVQEIPTPDNYHMGKNIHWPFSGNVVAKGLEKVSTFYGWVDYRDSIDRVLLHSVIEPVVAFGSFVEQFKAGDHRYTRYVDSDGNISNSNQTWTVTAYLYALKHFGILN